MALVPVHELLGLLLVLGLWGLAVRAAIARIAPAVVALALAYGLVVPVLDDPDLHVTARPVVYEVAVTLHPGEALS